MTMPIVDWQELDHEGPPPIVTKEILHLIPTRHAECDTKCLVILPHAVFDQMMLHLRGDRTTERIGILTGRPYTKSSNGQLLLCVDDAISVDDIHATDIRVAIQKSAWKDVWTRLSLTVESRIVGWYHSHPDHGVFLSATDRATQSLWFAQEWKVAIVVDPVRGEYQAFTGASGTPTPVLLI
jgi:proteasome lid subunit RPN8/RPN11